MSRRGVIIFGLLLASFWTFGLCSVCQAEMKIQLKDGSTITVPITSNDVVSITFHDKLAEESSDQIEKAEVTWDFETGDLTGWKAEAIGSHPNAFASQPTLGDNPTARKRMQPSSHQGEYWIGTFEERQEPTDRPGRVQGDKPQGTLTSEPFTLEAPNISFLIGGGCKVKDVGVELLVDGKSVRQATGKCNESMQRLSWDVSDMVGQTAQIRIYDRASKGWGHINVDDFRFD
jgi:hypothetical protein